MSNHYAIALALFALTLAVYAPVHGHAFLSLDDRQFVVDNPLLEGGLGWRPAVRAFTTPHLGNWVPLTTLSLQLDRSLHGGTASGVLLGNALLHALATACLLLALRAMTGAVGPSAFVAAVFGLHPLHVESVAWASERRDVLAGLWWMLALLAYARYAERPSLRRYLVVFAALALGLLSKPTLVTLPLVLLLLDYWPLGRLRRDEGGPWPDRGRLRKASLEKLPMLGLVAAVALVTLRTQSADDALYPLDALPIGLRVANAVLSYATYLADAVWPTGLAAFHPHPGAAIEPWQVGLSAALLAAISLLSLRFAHDRPYWIVGWLWYLGTLVPVIGLVQVGMQARADRYTYIPLIGVSLMLAWTAADWGAKSRTARRAVMSAALAALLGMGVATSFQLRHWADSEAVFRRVLAVTEDGFAAHAALGFVLRDAGRSEEAMRHFEQALRIQPSFVRARVGLAEVLVALGREREAIAQLERAVRDEPGNALAQGNLGALLSRHGRHARARSHLDRALALREAQGLPRSTAVHGALANTLRALGDPAASLRHYEIVLEESPHDATLLTAAGIAAQLAGRPQRAVEHYRAARAAAPDSVDAANNLAWLLATCREGGLRDPEEALRVIDEVISADSPPSLLDTQAAAYAAAGRFDRAREVLSTAIARTEGTSELAAAMRERAQRYAVGAALRDRCAGAGEGG